MVFQFLNERKGFKSLRSSGSAVRRSISINKTFFLPVLVLIVCIPSIVAMDIVGVLKHSITPSIVFTALGVYLLKY